MNYILFGGSGFIGTHLIHLLLKECVRPGDVIYDLDLVMPGEEGVVPGIVEKNDGVQYIRLDVRKPIDFEFSHIISIRKLSLHSLIKGIQFFS